MDWRSLIAVGCGSFLGGVLRYATVFWIERKADGAFPLGVLAVNALGSFVIGVLVPLYIRQGWQSDQALPLFLSVGVLGGYTTFSTFSLQTLRLLQTEQFAMAGAYALASFALCLVAVYGGVRLGQLVWG